MAEQAKILVAEAEEDNLDDIKFQWWNTCKQCGQKFHGVVAHALGWACWRTYAKALAKYIFDDYQMPPPPQDDSLEAINILTDVLGRARRVLGPSHPITTRAEIWLRTTRLAARVLRDDSDDSDDVPLATLARRKK